MIKGKGIQWRVIFLAILFLGTIIGISMFTHISLRRARTIAKEVFVREISSDLKREMTDYLTISSGWLADSLDSYSLPTRRQVLAGSGDTMTHWQKEGIMGFYVDGKGELISPPLSVYGMGMKPVWEKTKPVLQEMLVKSELYREYLDAPESNFGYYLFLKNIPRNRLYLYVIVDRQKILLSAARNLKGLEEHGQKIIANIIVVNVLAFLLFLFVSVFIIRQVINLEGTIHKNSIKMKETNLLLETEISIRRKVEEELKEANNELKRLSRVDGMTGIANRRAFDETLDAEWKRGMREKEPLALLLCDVDLFKKYNDRYGHQEGDVCLVEIAVELDKCCSRTADLAARYGGEEFAVILPGTDVRGAVKVGKEVRTRIEALAIEHADSSTGHVTISIGIAVIVPKSHLEMSELVKRADEALYQAKKGGRNRVEIYSS